MRYVPSSCLKPGMMLGKDLFGYNNELMLSKGQILSNIEINRIKMLKYQGVYIKDSLSDDIDTEYGISSELKNNAVKTVKDVFNQVKADSSEIKSRAVAEAMHVTKGIVSEITSNKNAAINMIDLKIFDDYTYFHSVNVSVISIILGVAMGLCKTNLYKLGLGALLHDIGKVFVPKDVLEKPGKLSPEEFELVKVHSQKGSEYLRDRWEIPVESNVSVLTHHEKFDGTGYPNNLRAEKIPLFGKIIAVADVYDALTSDRPYRKALSPSEAMEYIMGGSGTLFDPKIVNTFAEKITPYPVGNYVLLSNGLIGIVVENNSKCGLRPKVKIITGNNETMYYDLYNDINCFNITIKGLSDTV
ncbi:MAG: HD-GYP domain-containing protein [Clostridiales bacterium]|nr:HD-GYP domain-containing protein [Clostridiales bacterium]